MNGVYFYELYFNPIEMRACVRVKKYGVQDKYIFARIYNVTSNGEMADLLNDMKIIVHENLDEVTPETLETPFNIYANVTNEWGLDELRNAVNCWNGWQVIITNGAVHYDFHLDKRDVNTDADRFTRVLISNLFQHTSYIKFENWIMENR